MNQQTKNKAAEPVEVEPVKELSIVPSAPQSSALVELAGGINQIKQTRLAFENLKRELLIDSDFQTYTEKNVTKRFIKKSGWRNIGLAFGISLEPVGSEMRDLGMVEPGRFAIEYRVRATAPNGRYVEGVGSCDSHEERFAEKAWNEHTKRKEFTGRFVFEYNDVASTAYTRAANRAISDLVGGGEVSAEEISKLDVPAEADFLPMNWQKKLMDYANTAGSQGRTALALYLLDTLGTKHLNQDQAKEIGQRLAQLIGAPAVSTVIPADQPILALEEAAN